MARALALGWGEPVLCTDARLRPRRGARGGGRRRGRRLQPRAGRARRPRRARAQAGPARRRRGGDRRRAREVVVSILARTTQAEVRAAYPDTPVFRIEPNTPVELAPRRARLRGARTRRPTRRLVAQVRELFARLGTVVDVPEPLMRVAGATGGVGPAYWRAARRGAGRRRRPARHAAPQVAVDARHRDDGRLRRAAARARPRHAARCGAPSPRPAGPRRAGSRRSSAAASAPRSPQAMDDVVDSRDRLRVRAHGDRRLPRPRCSRST